MFFFNNVLFFLVYKYFPCGNSFNRDRFYYKAAGIVSHFYLICRVTGKAGAVKQLAGNVIHFQPSLQAFKVTDKHCMMATVYAQLAWDNIANTIGTFEVQVKAVFRIARSSCETVYCILPHILGSIGL